MSKPDPWTPRLENFPDAPPYFGEMFKTINNHMSQHYDALTKGLTFGDNMAAQLLQTTVTIPETPWREVQGGIGFLNSWANFAGALTVAFRILDSGKVEWKGTCSAGTFGTAVCQAPVGYRPPANVWFLPAQTAFSLAKVQSDGQIIQSGGNNGQLSLDGLSYYAQAPAAPPDNWNGITSGGQQWPVRLVTKLTAACAGLWVVGCQLQQSKGPAANASNGAPILDWSNDSAQQGLVPGSVSPSAIRINRISGLSPGGVYNLTLLAIQG